jgi:ElaB/YqjD/DUF883 family membrane-anchored ribosome-binding protein
MSVNNKHIATFLLGAAAGIAAFKYMNLTEEEKDKLASNLKDKAYKVQSEAEAAMEKAKDYFENLKAKGADSLKDFFAEAENYLNKKQV